MKPSTTTRFSAASTCCSVDLAAPRDGRPRSRTAASRSTTRSASGERRLILDVAARLSLWELWAGRDPTELLGRAVALEQSRTTICAATRARACRLHSSACTRAGWARRAAIFEALLAEAVALGDEIARARRSRPPRRTSRCAPGEWAQAEAHADAAYELAEQIGLEHDGGLTVLRKALVATQLGRVDEARSLAELGVAPGSRSEPGEHARHEPGRRRAARAVARQRLRRAAGAAAAARLGRRERAGARRRIRPRRTRSMRCAAAGRVEEASASCVDELESQARSHPEPVGAGDRDALPGPSCRRVRRRSRVRARLRRGRALAVRSNEAARCSCSDVCSDARSRRRPRRSRSNARWRSSRSCPLRCGRNARARSSAASAFAAPAPGELTASERRVAELAAAGSHQPRGRGTAVHEPEDRRGERRSRVSQARDPLACRASAPASRTRTTLGTNVGKHPIPSRRARPIV